MTEMREKEILKEAAKILMEKLAQDKPTNLEEKQTVTLTGFGTFKCYMRKSHSGINPATKKKIEVPAKLTVSFKPSTKFVQSLND
jgi:DNA-binding protein HU-beta